MTHHHMNALHLALACTYMFSGISLALGYVERFIDASIVIYVMFATAAGAGAGLAYLIRLRMLHMPLAKMSSPLEVEMRARFMLQHAISELEAKTREFGGRKAISDESLASVEEAGSSSQQKQDQKQQEQETGSQAAEEEQMDVTITDANPLFKDDEGVDDGESDKLSARAPPSGTLDADGRSTAPAPAPVKAKSEESDFDEYLLAASYSAMSIEARVQVVQDLVSKTALAETETLFKSANARFPTSSLLHLFQSRYYHTFKSDKHLNISHLLMAIRLGPPIDVAFLAFQARRMLESSSQSGILSSALHRVSFERHLAEARLNTVRAAQVQVAFWQELADPKPDLSAMHSHASSLARHSILAEQHFKDAFQLHPQSLTALRVFAQYNLTAANNPERAAAISAEADRIEDQTNKELMNGKNGAGRFQFYADVPNEGFSDSVAKITIGATSRDLGIILSANSAACKMFGYTRLQLERRNVNVIVPAPFSQAHDYFLRRYTSTGEGTVIETGRILLARHRSGHLVPYSMLVRDGLLPDGTLVFTASLRPVATNQTNIVMLDEAFNIYGGTQGALAQLAIETATLTESDVCMADFCPLLGDPEAVADLMAKAEGNVTPLRLPAAAPELAAVASVDDFDTQVPSFRKTLMSSKLDVVDAKVTLARTCVSDVVVFVMTWRSLTLAEANAQRTISSRRRPSRKEDGGEDTFSRSVSFHQDASGGATGRLSDVDSSMDGFHSGRHTREGEESGDDGSVSSLPPGHANLTAAALAGQGCPFPAGQRAMAARAAGGDVPLPVAEDRGERKKPKSGDGESSVGSESRRSSKGGIGRATFSKLRRILSDHRSGNVTKAVPGLFALYITGWALAILNLALASLSASLLDGNFATYFSNLEFSSIADDAVRAQVHAARLVMRRNLHNRGWLEQSADEIAATTADMSATADLYLSRTMDMYNLVIGTSFEPFFTALDCSVIDFTDVLPQPAGTVTDAAMTAMLEGETYWPLSTMDGSVLVGRRHATNFLDYSARWAGMLKQLSALPAANCTDQHPWSQFITVNTQLGSPAQIKVSRTTFAAYTASRNSRGTVTLATQWIFIAMGPVLSFIILCVVVPIILFVDRSRDDVMERFLDLPALIVSSMRTTAEKRLRSLRTDDEDAESDGEAEDDEELKKMTENIDYDDEDGGGTDWEALFQRAAVEASRAQRSETQHLNVQVGTEAAMPSGLLHTTTGPRAATSGRFTSSALCCARRGANDYPTWCSRGKRAPGGGYYRSVANPDGSVVNFVRRDHRKNSRSLWQLGAVFLMPIALMFVFYLVLFIVTMDTLNSVLNMSSFMIIASMRATAIETGHGSLFSMISQAGYPAENAFRHELTTRELVNLRSLNQFLAYGNELTLLPSVDYGLASDIDMASFEDPVGTETSVVPNLPDMSIITTAMLLNACPFVAPTDPDCTTFDGGVLTSGLQSAIMDYIVRNRRLRERSRFSTVPVTSTTGEGTTTMSASMEWATNPASAGGSAVAGPYSIPGVFKSADWLASSPPTASDSRRALTPRPPSHRPWTS
jgi:PAS domain S-box-containing protein